MKRQNLIHLLIGIVCVAAPLASKGNVQQAWVARYNGLGSSEDSAHAIALDSSGNIYVTGGATDSFGHYYYATVKYNPAGQQQWVAATEPFGWAIAMAVDSFGNVYVTGGFATVKYNSAGQQQWVAFSSGSVNNWVRAIAVDGAGNVYVTGESDYHCATIKYNSAGQEQWVASYSSGDGYEDYGTAIAVDASGDVYVAGGSHYSEYDYTTIKYNSTGQEQWVASQYASAGALSGIAIDSSGFVYVTGGNGTIKYDSAGQILWYGGYGGHIAVDDSGNVYVTGTSHTGRDYATAKYDSAGQEQWVAFYNGPANDEDDAHGIALDGSGNVYVTGEISVQRWIDSDYATIKYDSTGQEQWVVRYNGPANSQDYANAIAVDRSGNVYVTGSSIAAYSGDDYTTIKYVQGATPTPTPTATATPSGTPRPTPASPAANPATFVSSHSFIANWRSVSGATGYRLDVATNNSFTNCVAGYQNLNIGNALSRSVTGLSASTNYYYRVRAYNGNGTSGNSNVVHVTTLSPTGSPVAITNPATLIASFSAKLNGSVNPHGLITTVYFQYGRTTSYGTRTPNQTKTGNNYQNVSANISGLSAHTTYHFRIVASNASGTRYGTDRTLTTQ